MAKVTSLGYRPDQHREAPNNSEGKTEVSFFEVLANMQNRVKELLAAGKVAIGAQLRFGSPAIAELFARAGFDYIIPDCEHAPQTTIGVQAQLQAIAGTGAVPIVRVLKNDPDTMRPFLDMGALGILAPFVNTGNDARLGARALRYPPRGTRGFGPSRAAGYGLDDNYLAQADDCMIYLPIIEDAEAVENIDEILATEGVDSFIIGPADLSISLGAPMDFGHTKFKDAIRTIIKAAQGLSKPMGTAVYGGDIFNRDTYKRLIDEGFTLLLVGGDEWMLSWACKKLIDCVSCFKA